MASVNKVLILGHCGKDPELRQVGENQVCNFSIATSEKWKGRDGEQHEKTEWHRISAWGKLAEVCSKYISKGDLVYVEGRIQTSEFEKDWQEPQSTEINAQTVQFLGGKKERKEEKPYNEKAFTPPTPDEEVPF